MKKILLTHILIIMLSISIYAQLKIFSGGNISVGSVLDPASGFKFHVRGNSLFSDINFSGNSAAYIRGWNGFSNETSPDYTWWGNDQTGIFHPSINNIGFTIAGKERVRISNTGNLIVGATISGGFRVSIQAADELSALSTFTNFTAKHGYAHASYVNNAFTKNWVVVFNGTEKFFVEGNGNTWATNAYLYSDSILKSNVVTITDATAKVLELRGVSYNFTPEVLTNSFDTATIIDSSPPPTLFGFIAEEVEEVLPEVVGSDGNGIKGIAYTNIIPLLVEAFKEQNEELQNLRSQLELCCQSNKGLNSLDSQTIDLKMQKEPFIENSSKARLDQNTPNPFNLETNIHFYTPEDSKTRLILIFNIQGTLLKQYSISQTGEASLAINGNDLSPGLYLYSLVIDGKEIDTKRMILTN